MIFALYVLFTLGITYLLTGWPRRGNTLTVGSFLMAALLAALVDAFVVILVLLG